MKNILISLCLALFIISASVTITLNFRPLYYHDISSLKIEETSGFSKKVIRENYDALIDYNQFFYSGKLKLTLPMSREGKIHFEEVKRIFVGIEYLCVITLILSCFLIKRKIRSRNIDFLRSASIITVLLPVIVGILCAFNWDAAFTLFHEIMFRNDYWIFDEATDPVIMILPDAFFLHCAVSYETVDTVVIRTTLQGPEKKEKIHKKKTYPYIVIKMPYTEKQIIYE